MRFDRMALLAAGLVLACSSGKTIPAGTYAEVDLGQAPQMGASPLTTTAVAGDTVVFADASARAAHRIRIDPLELESSLPLPRTAATGGILVGDGGRYVVGLSGADVTIQGDVSSSTNPVTLPGRAITSAAFDTESHVVALSDDFEAIALIALAADGTVESAWLGGPVIAGAGAVGAGGFIGGGRLLAALGGGRLALIDARASAAREAWQYASIEAPEIDRPTFIAPLAGDDSAAVVGDDRQLAVLDVATGAIRSSWPLPAGETARPSSLGHPHLVHFVPDSPTPVRVVYPDVLGVFAEVHLKSRVAAGDLAGLTLEQSHLDVGRSLLTLVVRERRTSPRGRGTVDARLVLRYRTSDSLLTDVSELPPAGDVALAADYYLVRYPSVLGYVERRHYGRRPMPETLEKFNLDLIAR